MSSTPHLALPLIAAAQAQKHVTHNEALAALDALVQLAVKERGRTVPPAAPQEGDRFLVGEGATGAFAGREGRIALFDLGAWRFFTPRAGWRLLVENENVILVFDGAQWRDLGLFCRELAQLERLGLGTAADGLNRLAAKLNAALFSALSAEEGGTGDLRLVLNKSAEANVLSQLYQRGFSGRAETGLIGGDDFGIRVSPDGTQWHDALVIDRRTGLAAFPCGLANAPRPNLLLNGSLAVNQRRFAGGALAAGAYGFDRWKAGPGGCTVSRAADGTVTLLGALDQVIEVGPAAAQIGALSFAGATLTLSVENPSEPLPVLIGSKAVTIPAGSGRRAATVTLDASEAGNVAVRLHPASACSFSRVKLEAGAVATPWIEPLPEIEELRCRRYFQRLPVTAGTPAILGALGQRVGASSIDFVCPLPVAMRADPVLVTSGFGWAATSPAGNQAGFFNNGNSSWAAVSGALTVTTLTPPSASCAVLRLQAGTSFGGTAGSIGNLHLGASAFIALQAEL
ncbi:DUF2793 domain-containing protein [Microvirga arsenatis]|uniref:DUF2793 domain-containing protein n=1 Tax=Microvirga arsenatis TaxID=2692265 RepID=A0ABW9Z117_9HYPH|nr:DUF2793 domain-containing protein [Microvirga arsenatis]NBJ11517.1 DUF2793 domain-containing protein [Microvirga arsenatis]NBJ26356.1 DUF2793 domain-containing protein [Microvirga arsenatis]